jgi:hypothetical protein
MWRDGYGGYGQWVVCRCLVLLVLVLCIEVHQNHWAWHDFDRLSLTFHSLFHASPLPGAKKQAEPMRINGFTKLLICELWANQTKLSWSLMWRHSGDLTLQSDIASMMYRSNTKCGWTDTAFPLPLDWATTYQPISWLQMFSKSVGLNTFVNKSQCCHFESNCSISIGDIKLQNASTLVSYDLVPSSPE